MNSISAYIMNKLHFQVNENRRLKFIIVSILVSFITVLHYQTAIDYGLRHVFFRELYFVPIMLAAFWFGLLGGLATSLLISLAYGPYVLIYAAGPAIHDLGNLFEIVLFNIVGLFFGWLKDREKAQQDRARQAESLAAMGRAAAMIAHDLKSPLVTIGGLARRLTSRFSPETSEGEKAMVIWQQAARLEQLVMDILIFARPMKLSATSNDLCQLLQEAKETVNGVARANRIRIDMPTDERCECYLDYDKMMQVFINLLTNAIEVSSNGTTVKVSLHRYPDKLLIDFADRGTGIPENIAEKIFEPFVTGKNKGTGLGLPISKKIVEAHSGKLEYRNNPEAGVTFRVSIPAKQ
jgi:signal transduction histidine kinase